MPDQEVTHIIRLVSCGKCGKVAKDCKGYEAPRVIKSQGGNKGRMRIYSIQDVDDMEGIPDGA